MKSEKARQELDDGSWKVEVGFEDEEFDLPYYAVRVDVAQYAVEIAEQEAEERMRKELTRRHDPKDEMPEYYKAVEVKYKLSGLIRISTAWLSSGDAGGYLWTIDGTNRIIKNIVGWREIHE